MSKASPGELYFYFGAPLSFQGAEKDFGLFGSAGNPLPRLYFSKPHPFWNAIISYDVIINSLWISRNKLWHLPTLHSHLKTMRRPKENSPSISDLWGSVWKSTFVLLGVLNWGGEKRLLKKSGPELKYTAVGHTVRKLSKTRRYYFEQNWVCGYRLYTKLWQCQCIKYPGKPEGWRCGGSLGQH